jgi:ArsR family transcriptional regulator, arsenate/arsenite/antimonite-responsive transcriptional repressor
MPTSAHSKKQSTKSTVVTLDDVQASFRANLHIFAALGDTTRQDIVLLLAQHDQLNVNQITEHIPLSRPAVSHHLKVLLQADLVAMERVSRENYYRLTVDDALVLLRELVERAEVSCT